MMLQIVSDLHLEHDNPVPALASANQPWQLGDAVDEWLACEHTLGDDDTVSLAPFDAITFRLSELWD